MKYIALAIGLLGALGYFILSLQHDEKWFSRLTISVIGFGFYFVLDELEEIKNNQKKVE
jgi:hypothetical protein